MLENIKFTSQSLHIISCSVAIQNIFFVYTDICGFTLRYLKPYKSNRVFHLLLPRFHIKILIIPSARFHFANKLCRVLLSGIRANKWDRPPGFRRVNKLKPLKYILITVEKWTALTKAIHHRVELCIAIIRRSIHPGSHAFVRWS